MQWFKFKHAVLYIKCGNFEIDDFDDKEESDVVNLILDILNKRPSENKVDLINSVP